MASEWVDEYRVSFRTRLLLPFGLAFFAIIPMLSVFDAFADQPVALVWPGNEILWCIAAFMWLVLLWFTFVTARMLRYYSNPRMFAMMNGVIEIGGKRISTGHVRKVYGRAIFADVIVDTKFGAFSIHPQLTNGGVSALRGAFKRRFDAPGFEEIPWLVGK